MTIPSLSEFLSDPSWRGCSVAHRGAWHDTAENSLASVERAIELGCAFVEIDVQECADGTLICLHDNALTRTAHRPIFPAAYRWDQLGKMRLAHGIGGPEALMTDEFLPTLAELFEVTRGRIYIDLDAKRPDYLRAISDLAIDMGVAAEVNIKTWVMGPSEYKQAKAMSEATQVMLKPLMFVGHGNFDAACSLVADLNAAQIEGFFEDWDVTQKFADVLRADGRDIFVNTLDAVKSVDLGDSRALRDPDAVWGKLMDAGIRLLQTDEPEALQRYLGNPS